MSWSDSTQGMHYCDLYDDDSDLMPCERCHDCGARKQAQNDKYCAACE
jgi:hypothetical protein